MPTGEPQLYGGNNAKESIAADGEGEEIRIQIAAAFQQFSVRSQEFERLDIRHDGRTLQSPPVHIGRQRAADGEFIRPGLFLGDGPAGVV